jgi:hypothetical protein
MSPNCSASHSANVTHSPYARAPDLTVTVSRIAVQYLTPIFHQHTEAKDVITSEKGTIFSDTVYYQNSSLSFNIVPYFLALLFDTNRNMLYDFSPLSIL